VITLSRGAAFKKKNPNDSSPIQSTTQRRKLNPGKGGGGKNGNTFNGSPSNCDDSKLRRWSLAPSCKKKRDCHEEVSLRADRGKSYIKRDQQLPNAERKISLGRKASDEIDSTLAKPRRPRQLPILDSSSSFERAMTTRNRKRPETNRTGSSEPGRQERREGGEAGSEQASFVDHRSGAKIWRSEAG